jgi:hypothetical protein
VRIEQREARKMSHVVVGFVCSAEQAFIEQLGMASREHSDKQSQVDSFLQWLRSIVRPVYDRALWGIAKPPPGGFRYDHASLKIAKNALQEANMR